MYDHRVLLTGATGFVGRVVGARLVDQCWEVRRTGHRHALDGIADIPLGPDTDWSAAIEGCDAVVHLAARAHVLREDAADPLAAFRLVNTAGTLALAHAAAAAGVSRFVFVSSIAVHGDTGGDLLRETDRAAPRTAYGISKFEAEEGLRALAKRNGLPVTILRPPLVYGPRVGARFGQLLRLASLGVPLPLGAIRNRRSLVGVDNLADAIVRVLGHPGAVGRTYLISDDEVISTPELVRQLATGMGRRAMLLNVPPDLLRYLAKLARREEELDKLAGSLVVDSGLIRRELSWTPPKTLEAGLRETAQWFAARRAS